MAIRQAMQQRTPCGFLDLEIDRRGPSDRDPFAMGRDWRDYFLRSVASSGRFGMLKQDLAMPDEAVTLEYLLDNHWIVGDPDTVAQKIRALAEQVGGFGTLLVIAHDWPDPAVWDRSTTLLAHEVMPRLADLGAPALAPA